MTWGMFRPAADNDFWPNGDFVGYKEALEYYYHNEMTDEEKAEMDMGDRFLFSKFGRKFLKNLGPLQEIEQPKEFRTKRTYKTLGSLISLLDQKLAVDEALKEIIERLEPGVHQFWPMKITMPKGKAFPAPYFGMVIHNHLEAFCPSESDAESLVHRKTKYSDHYHAKDRKKASMAGIAISREAAGAAHLWREENLMSPDIFLSDALQAEIEKAGLRLPKMFKLKDV